MTRLNRRWQNTWGRTQHSTQEIQTMVERLWQGTPLAIQVMSDNQAQVKTSEQLKLHAEELLQGTRRFRL